MSGEQLPATHIAMLDQMRKRIARQLAVGMLSCQRCGRYEWPTEDQFLQYLASGWPVCCELTMRYFGPEPAPSKGGAA